MSKNKLIMAMMIGALSLPSFASDSIENVSKDERVIVQVKSSENKKENVELKNDTLNEVKENKTNKENIKSSDKKEDTPQKKWVKSQNKMAYNELIKNIDEKNVKLIIFSENFNDLNNIRLELKNGDKYRAAILQRIPFLEYLKSKDIKIDLIENFSTLEEDQLKEADSVLTKYWNYTQYYTSIVFMKILDIGGAILQLLIIFGLLYYIMYKFLMSSKSGSVKKINPEDIDVSFADIAGNQSAKEDIQETIDYFKNEDKYKKMGVPMQNGVLLEGPPGNGKTMFAKAIAKECGASFFNATGSEFEEMFAGLGAKRVRDLFKNARKAKKAVIFIDEIDSMAKKRGGINDYHEQTLNQLLTEMDGFKSKMNGVKVLVIAATNRKDVLDEAILRPGRFDRKLYIGKPTKKDRIEIFKIYVDKAINASNGELKLGDIDYEAMGALTNGFSGAELKHLVDEALLLMIRENTFVLDKVVFRKAKDKVMLGNQRKDLEIRERERKITAYHEVGHAFASIVSSNGNRVVEGITIIPHDKALGVTFNTETHDPVLKSKEEMYNELRILLGGRAAENVFFNSVTNGASNDLERANAMLYDMIVRYGMSNKLPLLNITSYAQYVSDKTKSDIEQEISETLNSLYENVQKLIKEHKDFFHEAVQILIDQEVIDKEEFINLCDKHEITKLKFEEI